MATDKQDSLIFYKSEDGNIQLNVKAGKRYGVAHAITNV